MKNGTEYRLADETTDRTAYAAWTTRLYTISNERTAAQESAGTYPDAWRRVSANGQYTFVSREASSSVSLLAGAKSMIRTAEAEQSYDRSTLTSVALPYIETKVTDATIGNTTIHSVVRVDADDPQLTDKSFSWTVEGYPESGAANQKFEEWYNHQLKYRKVDGPPPLVEEVTETMTLEEMREELGIPRSTAYQIVAERDEIKHSLIDGAIRVERKDYERWYEHQFRFRKVMGEPPGQAYPASMSPHEMCDLLGIRLRNAGYCLTKRGLFDTFMVDGQLRIDSVSFEKWYKGQTHYKKVKSNIGGSYHGIHRKEEE